MKRGKRGNKKRNPNDATMRNVRAQNKRIAKIEKDIKELKALVGHLLSHRYTYL